MKLTKFYEIIRKFNLDPRNFDTHQIFTRLTLGAFQPTAELVAQRYPNKWEPVVVECTLLMDEETMNDGVLRNISVNVGKLYSVDGFRKFVREIIAENRQLDHPLFFQGNDSWLISLDETVDGVHKTLHDKGVKPIYSGMTFNTEEDALEWFLMVWRFYYKWSFDFVNSPKTVEMVDTYAKCSTQEEKNEYLEKCIAKTEKKMIIAFDTMKAQYGLDQ